MLLTDRALSGPALGEVDDQRWFTRYSLRHPELVAVDAGGAIFHSLHAVADGALGAVDATGVVWSQLTGTAPCFIHGNAGGRAALARVAASFEATGGWLGVRLSSF